MVITREIREEIETTVNSAVNKSIKTESLISEIAQKVSEAIIKTIQQKLLSMEKTVAELQKKNDTLESKLKSLETKINDSDKGKDEMERKLDQIDQSTRSTNLRIFNLKETQNEDTRTEVMRILNNKMSLNLSDADIQLCYRIGKGQGNKSRGIFLKLKQLTTKQTIYGKKKLLKGTNIVVREDLTTLRVNMMNEAIGKLGLKNVWTENGKIYVNKDSKITIIRNKNDLRNVLE
ncbi:unnamed protein product [Phaedon cochleariae]|uniref:Uncharacterized protein n=1 Tax=Phaedon cochleariae TaxID=80249 RepID=A0A9P0DPZ8_PHACE|nr:unnamed protein product [Phaedon cochleariae]